VLHLDLHPGNVMLTSKGPVVIDWSNVRSGPAGADVAMTYLLMASSEVDDLPLQIRATVGAFRGTFIRHFLLAAHDDPGPHIARVARQRHDRPQCPAVGGGLAGAQGRRGRAGH
jgi:hypothetical protein